MLRRSILILLGFAVTLPVGGVAGWIARRQAATLPLPDRPHRPACVEQALTAWAGGDEATLQARMETVRELRPRDPGIQAEMRFLVAALAGDRRGLGEVAAHYGTQPAGARARWLLIEQTPRGPTRDAMHSAFARAYPDAWVLTHDGSHQGGS